MLNTLSGGKNLPHFNIGFAGGGTFIKSITINKSSYVVVTLFSKFHFKSRGRKRKPIKIPIFCNSTNCICNSGFSNSVLLVSKNDSQNGYLSLY